eukprot:1703625-Rhodomonas_salina.5
MESVVPQHSSRPAHPSGTLPVFHVSTHLLSAAGVNSITLIDCHHCFRIDNGSLRFLARYPGTSCTYLEVPRQVLHELVGLDLLARSPPPKIQISAKINTTHCGKHEQMNNDSSYTHMSNIIRGSTSPITCQQVIYGR